MSLVIQKASAEDIPLIRKLARSIWTNHYTPIIGEDQVSYMLNLMYSAASLQDQMQQHQQFYILHNKQQPIGFISLSQKAEDELFLHKFYLETDQQKSGLGTQFLKLAEALFPQKKNMRLTVNRKNFKSINFYFKNGFQIEEVKDFDIGNNYWMEDFVMIKNY